MKKILSLFIFGLFISQAYSLAGFGVYGNYDFLKYPSGGDVVQRAGVNPGYTSGSR